MQNKTEETIEVFEFSAIKLLSYAYPQYKSTLHGNTCNVVLGLEISENSGVDCAMVSVFPHRCELKQ